MCHRSWSWARRLVERWRCAEIGPGLSPHRESPHSAYWLGKERRKERVPPALFLQAESSYPEIHSYPNIPETLRAGFWKWGTSTISLSILEFKFMPLTPFVRSSPWTAIEPEEQCLSPWENGKQWSCPIQLSSEEQICIETGGQSRPCFFGEQIFSRVFSIRELKPYSIKKEKHPWMPLYKRELLFEHIFHFGSKKALGVIPITS